MFSVGYGIANREKRINKIALTDGTTALILAAVHFEWMIKRSILKLGCSPTSALRNELEEIYKLAIPGNNKKDYRSIWKREVSCRFKNAQLGKVLGNLHTLQNSTMKVRGRVIHGNGTVSQDVANDAINEFMLATGKLASFAVKHGENLDEKLKTRIKAREVSV
ncbi:MAG: hypothetical protein AB2672_08705 [Candidatus Thiodiazotropha endolucinida]